MPCAAAAASAGVSPSRSATLIASRATRPAAPLAASALRSSLPDRAFHCIACSAYRFVFLLGRRQDRRKCSASRERERRGEERLLIDEGLSHLTSRLRCLPTRPEVLFALARLLDRFCCLIAKVRRLPRPRGFRDRFAGHYEVAAHPHFSQHEHPRRPETSIEDSHAPHC